jgi:hypothetical protein
MGTTALSTITSRSRPIGERSAEAPAAFWVQFLYGASIFIILFGLALLVAAAPLQPLFGLLYFGAAEHLLQFTPGALSYIEFKDGVIGSLILGLGLMLLTIVHGPFRRGVPESWGLIAGPVAVWFAAESASSILCGFGANILLCAPVALLIGVPLAATYRHFHP